MTWIDETSFLRETAGHRLRAARILWGWTRAMRFGRRRNRSWRPPMILYLIWKWLVCSWLHWKERMYCQVWVEGKGQWHCGKCHPCDEGLLQLLKAAEPRQRPKASKLSAPRER